VQSSFRAYPVGPLTPDYTKAARLALEVYVGMIPWDANALSALADLLVSDYLNRWNEAENNPAAGKHLLREAELRLEQASAIDSSLPIMYYVKGLILRAKHQHDAALKEFETAVALDPNCDFPSYYAQTGNQYVNVGEPAKALPLVARAIQQNHSDPSIGVFYWIKGRAYFFMSTDADYDNAIVWLEKSVAERPNLWYNRLYLVSAYALRKRIAEARSALDAFKRYPEFAAFTPATLDAYEKDIPNTHRLVVAGLDAFHNGLKEVQFWPP